MPSTSASSSRSGNRPGYSLGPTALCVQDVPSCQFLTDNWSDFIVNNLAAIGLNQNLEFTDLTGNHIGFLVFVILY